MNKRYIDLHTANVQADGRTVITTDSPVRYLKAGYVIISNKTGASSTIYRVNSSTSFVINAATGFTAGTSAIVYCDTFDGLSLSRYFPQSIVNDDFISFLHPFAMFLQDMYAHIIGIPYTKNVALCPANLVQYLAKSKGIQLNSADTEAVQREVLNLLEYMYRHKGTKPSIEKAFAAKGYDAEVKELYCGKYANRVQSASGTTLTLYAAGAALPSSGGFSPRDIISLSTGSGSTTPTTFDGTYGSIETVNSTYSFEMSAEDVAKFSPDDYVVVFAYSYLRDSTDYPFTSSFVNILFTDRLYPPRTFTTEILEELVSYMQRFLPSYARLWAGTGIERVISILLSFKQDFEVTDRGPLLEMDPGAIDIVVPVSWDGTFSSYLDSGGFLDEDEHLDAYPWLTMGVQINFETAVLEATDSVNVTEQYTATAT